MQADDRGAMTRTEVGRRHMLDGGINGPHACADDNKADRRHNIALGTEKDEQNAEQLHGDPEKNIIELALWEELFKTELTARDFNWLVDEPSGPVRASVRVRHTKWEEPACVATPLGNGSVRIVCEEPVRAPAPGQSAVLYDGERVLGGGFIV